MRALWLIPMCALAACGPEKAEPEPRRPDEPVVAPEPVDQGEEREVIADDGRPEWWYPEVRRSGSSMMFCVETIAEDTLRAAGRDAVHVAEKRARIECDRAGFVFDTGAMIVEKTWGWPLPDLPGRSRRYAGYAQVTIYLDALVPKG